MSVMQLPTKSFPSIMQSVYTDRILWLVYTNRITDGIFRILKKSSSLTLKFLWAILPTELPRDSNRDLRTVT